MLQAEHVREDDYVDDSYLLFHVLYSLNYINGRIRELEQFKFLDFILFRKFSKRIKKLKETKKCLEKTLFIVNGRKNKTTMSDSSLS